MNEKGPANVRQSNPKLGLSGHEGNTQLWWSRISYSPFSCLEKKANVLLAAVNLCSLVTVSDCVSLVADIPPKRGVSAAKCFTCANRLTINVQTGSLHDMFHINKTSFQQNVSLAPVQAKSQEENHIERSVLGGTRPFSSALGRL